MLPTATVYAGTDATIGASASRASSTGRLLELLALVWNQTPDSLTGLPYFLSGECLTLKSGYGESYLNLFLTRPI